MKDKVAQWILLLKLTCVVLSSTWHDQFNNEIPSKQHTTRIHSSGMCTFRSLTISTERAWMVEGMHDRGHA